ncbi:ATP-binding protein [Sphingomonas astaxanthinifaciens]|uniref:ATP-binding protein n=1 Tax=Sphingomonas astaxanthinifaciens DSM 22298 TaxID=1123267 RepID=A0ABQ5Z789_9SPHN|nr:ATP-binding protein [Sphingomonas astaxanthinifaciens]GLR46743.1 ATP-binding protein [Sphingomonas astaxanthinifaciens DSM 22298]
MTVAVDMGLSPQGQPVTIDLEELLATRLLVQGNSGSGKSHLLRRLLEKSAGQVQQIVIDPEGDFVTLAGPYGHLAIEAADHDEKEIARAAARIREHRASVVLSLEGLEAEGQMRCAAAFLSALFEAPRDHWYPALVVVDEAQLFAPAGGGEVAEEVRRASLSAMTNLMCRGRKRGLAGIIATQRLAKLAKNVAAEASNFLMGRTFLDIDMARAADLLGMERRQAEAIRDLPRGTFLALGPAISRRPLSVAIGEVETRARSMSPKLVPLPTATASEDLQELLFQPGFDFEPAPAPKPDPRPLRSESLMEMLAGQRSEPAPALPSKSDEEQSAAVAAVLEAMVADHESRGRSGAVLFQDFTVRLRMAGVSPSPLDLPAFTRRLAMARAGIFTEDPDWHPALEAAEGLPEDMLGPFLLLARAARDSQPTPSDEAIAASYGTASLGRARRLLSYIESRDLIVTRTDLSGKRSIAIPRLGWSTAAA